MNFAALPMMSRARALLCGDGIQQRAKREVNSGVGELRGGDERGVHCY